MITSKSEKIKSKIILTDVIKLKSKGIFIILLLFPLALILSTIYSIYKSNPVEKSNILTLIISFIALFILAVIPCLKKGLATDNQKNIYIVYTLKNKILLKQILIPNNYNEFIIIEEPFSKSNTNITINNKIAEFKYPIYKFVAQRKTHNKPIFTVDNKSSKNELQTFLEIQSNLKHKTC